MNRVRAFVGLWFLLIAPLLVVGQNHGVSLLAVECEAVEGSCARQSLVRFRFRDGVLVSKDLILTSDTAQVRYDLGENHIYENRYVITNSGDVVDIQNKELLHEGIGVYVATEGDRVIQYVNQTDIRGHFYYDLKSHRYQRISGPNKWALPGTLSPDRTKSVDGGATNIWLHRLGHKRKLLGSGFFVQADMRVSFLSQPPFFWLDNTRILSQRNNGEVVVVEIDGTVTPIVKIAVKEENLTAPYFFRDREGRIIYECCGESFVINLEEKSYKRNDWPALGFGFDATNNSNPAHGHVIRYQGKEIGKVWASIWSAPTISGHIAFAYGEVGSNLRYPKGIKVWSEANGQWTTIDLKWLNQVIGWIHY